MPKMYGGATDADRGASLRVAHLVVVDRFASVAPSCPDGRRATIQESMGMIYSIPDFSLYIYFMY